jgi:hypothetical protein
LNDDRKLKAMCFRFLPVFPGVAPANHDDFRGAWLRFVSP